MTPNIKVVSVADPVSNVVSGISKLPPTVTKKDDGSWKAGNLSNADERLSFQLAVTSNIQNYRHNESKLSSTSEKWKALSTCVKEAASKTLNVSKSPITPSRRAALANFQKSKSTMSKNPLNPIHKAELRIARDIKNKAYHSHVERKCDDFFSNLLQHDPQERLKLMYKFLKQFRRNVDVTRRGTAYIPLSRWEAELTASSIDPMVNLVEENDHFPIGPPLSVQRLKEYLARLKNGTAPGIDRINMELFKYGPEVLLNELAELLEEVYLNNSTPTEWLITTQIPIPKIKRPEQLSDFRRITICSTAYKLYAKFLLEELNKFIDLPLYQAGFQRNRSCDDHTFVIKKLLDERWKKGLKTYVLALDIKQAFDRLMLKDVPLTLAFYGVPHYLINRIINACLFETTSVQWFGRRTRECSKTRGVKQGCPLSPNIFVAMLHALIETVTESLGNYDLSGRTLTLPLLLGYADDLVQLSGNLANVDDFVKEFVSVGSEIGLELNPTKCKLLLIRDPANQPKPKMVKLGDLNVAIVNKLKYLRNYLSDTLNRPNLTRERIKTVYRVCYSLMPFLRRQKLSSDLIGIGKIYESVLIPVVSYGLKVSTLTKRNRNSLRKMESRVLKLLLSTSSNQVDDKKPSVF